MHPTSTRPAAVSGMFYPDDPSELRAEVQALLAAVTDPGAPPKAAILPHAGFVYSGPIAATGYATLRAARHAITRVVLMGPAHRVWVEGMATVSVDAFATPLGDVPVDREAIDRLRALPQVSVSDEVHRQEHSLEVHLPFLLEALDSFSIVPLCVGGATPDEVAEVLEVLWGGPETLVVISSDLSHHNDYETASRMDAATTEAIERLSPARIGRQDACGRAPIRGLLTLATRLGLRAETVDLRNSGDTAGSRRQVVGYGAYVFR